MASPRWRYGIESEAYRAKEAEDVLNSVVHGCAFDTHCSAESFSRIFENQPYDFEMFEGEWRMEPLPGNSPPFWRACERITSRQLRTGTNCLCATKSRPTAKARADEIDHLLSLVATNLHPRD